MTNLQSLPSLNQADTPTPGNDRSLRRPASFLGLILGVLAVHAEPPRIEIQPQARSVALYQDTFVYIIADGSAPLGYQWLKDGVALSGATNDFLHLPKVTFPDAGRYSVVVSNAETSVQSLEANLTVNAPKAGGVDASFSVESDLLEVVRLVSLPGGKLLANGWSPRRAGTMRLNQDGTRDYTFAPSGEIYASAVSPLDDGRLVVASWMEPGKMQVVRLHKDGSLDLSFAPAEVGPVGNSSIYVCAPHPDGRVYIGGSFTTVNGIVRSGCARMNVDGTLDSTFAPRLAYPESGNPPTVFHIVTQADGKVIVSGIFTKADGSSRPGIARFNPDGILDTSFIPDRRVNLGGSPILPQPDGKFIVSISSPTIYPSGVGRLNPDGSLDESFPSAGLWDWTPSASLGDGKIVVTSGTASAPRIARLNADGTFDSSFKNVLADEFGLVRGLVVEADGSLLLAGLFTPYADGRKADLLRFRPDGHLDSVLDTEFARSNTRAFLDGANAIAFQSDEKLIVGGRFYLPGQNYVGGLARFDSSGALDTSFHNGIFTVGQFDMEDSTIRFVATQSDDSVLFGRTWTFTDDESSLHSGRLTADGDRDTAFLSDDPAFTSAVQPDGKVLVGAESSPYLVRLNRDGSRDASFQISLYASKKWTEASPKILSIQIQKDGKILIGGFFQKVDGISRIGLARLRHDGSLDDTFELPDSSLWLPTAISLQPDGRILVATDRIARLNPDGSYDRSFLTADVREVLEPRFEPGFQYPSAFVAAMAVQPDGRVLIRGPFVSVNGTRRNGIARLNADGTLDAEFQHEMSGITPATSSSGDPTGIRQILLQRDGRILVAGDIRSVNGVPVPGIARLWGSADLPPRITGLSQDETGTRLSWEALPGRAYRVQYKTSLSDPAWIDLPGDIPGSPNGTGSKGDPGSAKDAQRVYRVILQAQE